MSRGFDFDSFGMDDFRESDSYDRGRETTAGRGGGSLSNTSVRLHDLTVNGPSITTATECIRSGHRRSKR